MALLLLLLVPWVQAEDCSLLCLNQTSVCTITNRVALCDIAVKFTTSTSISIVNSTLYCVHVQNKGEPVCGFALNSNIVTIQTSRLISSKITIHATTVNISAGSVLNANGTGYLVGSGTVINSGDAPSYGGRGGGTCGELINFLTYGDQEDPREFYGSGGFNVYTKGGGIIIVEADNFYFDGVITASGNIALNDTILGTPSRLKEDANGGTGGSVYIRVAVYGTSTGKIIAAGGNAINSGFGGGGGRVVVYGKFKPTVIAPGGVGTGKRCHEGGAGTVYFAEGAVLVVDNNGITTRNPTPISTEKDFTVIIRNGATVTPVFSHMQLEMSKLELTNSRLEASQVAGSGFVFDSTLSVIANEINLIGKSIIGRSDVESMNITATNLIVDYSSGIYFGSKLRIKSDVMIDIKGEIEGRMATPEPCWILITTALFIQRKESRIKANKVGILGQMISIEGMIQASGQSCAASADFFQQRPPYHFIKDGVNLEITEEKLPTLLESNFSHLIVGVNVTASDPSQLFGSRIGIFGTSINLSGMISASAYGCLSYQGIGRGDAKENACAGSGAGYGGRGGSGRPIRDEYAKMCEDITAGGQAYSDALSPWFEGSGGGSELVVGGAGGGFIDIEASGVLSITGMISADGEDAPREASNLRSGSGGGSGGGIFIKTRKLVGAGSKISAAGGRGTVKGGGGGGGRILFSWIGKNLSNGVHVNELNHTLGWDGIVEVAGGAPGEECSDGLRESGANGTLRAEFCAPGSAGYLCTPCKSGTYKEGYEYTPVCLNCSNKPYNGYYSIEAETNATCAYECSSGFTHVSTNPECNSPIKEFFAFFGGIGGAIGVTLGALSLVALVALLLIDYCSKLRRKYQQSDLQKRLIPTKEVMSERKMPKKKAILPELTKEDLPFHQKRIYLTGDNSYHRPWCLPSLPPQSIDSDVIAEKFAEFSAKLNERVRWFRWQHFTCWVLLWVYHPLGLLAFHMFRKRKYQEGRDFIQATEEEMWLRIDVRIMANSLRFSCSEDYTLAFIDIIDSSKKVEQWEDRPELPLVLLTEGDGSIYKPFRLDPDDLLLQLVAACFDSDALEEYQLFIHEFNSKMRTIRLDSPVPNRNQAELLSLRTLLEDYNESLFQPAHYQMMLALFQAPMYVYNGKCAENRLSGHLNADYSFDYSSQLKKCEMQTLYSFRLGLICMDAKNKKPAEKKKEGKPGSQYYEPNVVSLGSEDILKERGIAVVTDPLNSAPLSECSLRSLLLVTSMWNQHIVLFILALLVLLDITIKLMLLLDFITTNKTFGFVMFGCVMPGVNVITPILGILMLPIPQLTVIYVSFQLVCCSSTVMTSIYLIESNPDWFSIGFLLSQLFVKLLSIRFAVMYKANVESVSMIEKRSKRPVTPMRSKH